MCYRSPHRHSIHWVTHVQCISPNYDEQIQTIVQDMRSLGIRQNDMLKTDHSDIVIDADGIVHLTDFGWEAWKGSLAITCHVKNETFSSPNVRPKNVVLDH